MGGHSDQGRRILALVLDILVILSVLAGLWGVRIERGALRMSAPSPFYFRTFTVLSNLYAALCCALTFPFGLASLLNGRLRRPRWLNTLRFISVCAVAVTFLTVLLFLGPTQGYPVSYRGTGFWLHLVSPLLAAAAFFLPERERRLSLWEGLLGALPVFAYGMVYYVRVVRQSSWRDFYGFNRGGAWPLAMLSMFPAAIGLALLLRALYNRRRASGRASC